MKLKNLTPHPVKLFLEDGRELELPPEGPAPRVRVKHEPVGHVEVEGSVLPVIREVADEIENLPPQEDGVLLLVSRVVAQAATYRKDLVVPAEYVRDDSGLIVGIRAVARI